MRTLFIILVCSFSLTSYAQSNCTLQNYDRDSPPNFLCPGPDELDLLPNIEVEPSVPVLKGQTVKIGFDGAIVDKMRLIEIGLKLENVRRLRWLDRKNFRTESKIREEYSSDLCKAKMDSLRLRSDMYKTMLSDSKAREVRMDVWYRSVWFGLVVGTVVTAGLITLSAYLLHLVDS